MNVNALLSRPENTSTGNKYCAHNLRGVQGSRHLGRFERIVHWELDVKEEDTTLIRRACKETTQYLKPILGVTATCEQQCVCIRLRYVKILTHSGDVYE